MMLIGILTANCNSKIPEIKNAHAVKVPPATILCKGFFNKLSLQKIINQVDKTVNVIINLSEFIRKYKVGKLKTEKLSIQSEIEIEHFLPSLSKIL